MQIDTGNNRQEYGNEYAGIVIDSETIDGEVNTDGKKYYTMAFQFTKWFLEKSGLKDVEIDGVEPFKISSTNDPEDENSIFVKHKRKIMKNKIEGVLNSTITAYSERTWGQIYKMPKLIEDDWKKIYSNISMLTFFQGKSIGLTKYNGYCVANSTNSKEYVNPNLMYFTDGSGEYHDIRCSKCGLAVNLNGYRIGAFEKKKVEKLDASGNIVYDADGKAVYEYIYDHNELACYNCINGTRDTSITVYEYIKPNSTASDETIKTAYWTSLGRERYDPNKITPIDLEIDVRFDKNEGSGDFSAYARTYSYNQNIIFPAETPTKSGYKFYGWSEVKDELDNITSAQALVDITYYASWIGNQYTVEYHGNGHSGGSTASSIHTYGEPKNLTPNGFAKTGHTFAGWKENATGREFDDQERVINLAEDDGAVVNLYAKWRVNTYTVEYNANGGTGSTASSTHKYGEAKNLTANGFTREGYLFKGWAKDPYGSVEYINQQSVINLSEIDGATVTLYAVWDGIEYTVEYHGNGHSGGSTASSIHKYGVSKNLTANGYTRTGYTFEGWAESVVGSVKYSDQESVINLASTNGAVVKLFAKWKPITYTVAYNGNGNTGGNTTSSTHTYGVDKMLTANGFTREGYTFKEWAKESPSGSERFSNRQIVKNLTDVDGATVTLFAIWEGIEYTVEYDGNGATGGSTASSTHKYGEAKNLTANGYTKTGYTFIGWAKSASGSVEYSNKQSVSNLTTTNGGTVRLYAVWKINTYTVVYNANGGTGTMANTTHTYGVASNLRENAFTRSGYTFEGWSESESGSVKYSNKQSVTNLTTTNGGIVNLYAKWKVNIPPPVFITNREFSVKVSKSSSGRSHNVNLEINIESALASNVSKYEISILRFGEVIARQEINSTTREVTLTYENYIDDWDGSENKSYAINIKAINANNVAIERSFNFWVANERTTKASIGIHKVDGIFEFTTKTVKFEF